MVTQLNTQYSNIKFTFEKQVNNQSSFLNVLVTNDRDQFWTLVFCKKNCYWLIY